MFRLSTRRVARITVFLALSVAGSFIPLGPTVALDSLAGYFVAAYYGLPEGAIVLALGCMLSHFTKGLIALIPIIWTSYPAMALAGSLYAYCYRRFRKPLNIVFAIALAVFVNTFGVLIPLCFVWGLAMMLPYFPILAYASFINAFIAALLADAVKRYR